MKSNTKAPTSVASVAPVATIEATIEADEPLGRGVAFHTLADGRRRAVFVPLAARGDRVRLAIFDRGKELEGRVLERISDGPDRVAAACVDQERCGGCDLLQLSATGQAARHLAVATSAFGDLLGGVVPTMHAPPVATHYRVRARLHARFERSARGQKSKLSIGFHAPRSHEIITPHVCHALRPELEAIRTKLPELLVHLDGDAEISLALGKNRRPVLAMYLEKSPQPAFLAPFEKAVLAEEIDGAQAFIAGSARPMKVGDPTPMLEGPDGAPLELAPGGFSQASEPGNRALAAHVAAVVDALVAGPAKVTELYAGAGNFTILLAKNGRKVTTWEADNAAVEAARRNLRARGVANVTVKAGDADLAPLDRGLAAVVLDPPRKGAYLRMPTLRTARPKAIVYVSCDLITLTRDLRVLTEGGVYTVDRVDLFPLFPGTSHVETVVVLTRSHE